MEVRAINKQRTSGQFLSGSPLLPRGSIPAHEEVAPTRARGTDADLEALAMPASRRPSASSTGTIGQAAPLGVHQTAPLPSWGSAEGVRGDSFQTDAEGGWMEKGGAACPP